MNLLMPFGADQVDKDNSYGGVLRKADWPKPDSAKTIGHYFSLIRMFRYGQKHDPLYFQYGQFFGYTMGHGTIVDRYNNSFDLDNPKPGLAFAFNRPSGGLEVFTDNIAGRALNIVAGRGYVRPLALFGSGEPGFVAKRWGVGLTYAMDRNTHMLPGVEHNAAVFGVDTEFILLQNSLLEFIPYMDLNYQKTDSNAGGLHIGAMAKFRFPLVKIMNMWARLEYRLMQPGYIAGYFDSVYDMQRVQFPVNVNGFVDVPKAAAGRAMAPQGPLGLTALKSGVFGEATVDVLRIVQGGAAYFWTPGVEKSNNISLFATLPVFKTVKFSGYYIRRNFDSPKEIVKLDERSLLMAAIQYKIWGPFWASGVFSRRWVGAQWAEDDIGHERDPIKFKGVNEWNLGVQLVWTPDSKS
jgi:hypothetical protein